MTNPSIAQPGYLEPGAVDEAKLRYYTAGQWRLVWWRFRRNRLALIGGVVLFLFFLIAFFAEFIAPYAGDTVNASYVQSRPQILRFCDDKGCSLRPFVFGFSTQRDPVTLRQVAVVDPEVRRYIQFFVQGDEYTFWLTGQKSTLHLFGLDNGTLHLFGTDNLGRDLFSRTVYATRTSLTLGVAGVVIALVLGIIMGSVAGFFGGRVDFVIMRAIEIIRAVPRIPLFLGLAAALPREWTPQQVYLAITLILGFLSWTALARRIRGKILSLREEDYVLSARISGASNWRIIARHMLPGVSSLIIVEVVIAFPEMILNETALSFVGLGLRPPVISWGVLLQGAQNIQALELAPWLFIPVIFVVLAVLAFVFLGDGLRDAADPYNS